MKVRKFKIDEWVLYAPFFDSSSDTLRAERKKAVILEVLKDKEIYDYRIFIDDGTSKIRKVKESVLFEVEQK